MTHIKKCEKKIANECILFCTFMVLNVCQADSKAQKADSKAQKADSKAQKADSKAQKADSKAHMIMYH